MLPRWQGIGVITFTILLIGWCLAVFGVWHQLPPPPRGDEWFHIQTVLFQAWSVEFPFSDDPVIDVSKITAIARSCFWIALFWLLLAGLFSIIRRRVAVYATVKVPNHLLVFGCGNTALNTLAVNIRRRRPGVALLPRAVPEVQKQLDANRIGWFFMDGGDRLIAQATQSPGATLLAADVSDTANVGFIDQLSRLVLENEAVPDLSVIVRISDGQLRRQLSERFLRRPEFSKVRMVLFSDDELRARQATRMLPAFYFCMSRQVRTAHLAVVGGGHPAEVMLVHLLKTMHFPVDVKVLFSVIDVSGSGLQADFSARFPQLAQYASVDFVEIDCSNLDDLVFWLTSQRDAGHDVTGFYLAQGNRAEELKTAFAIEDAYQFLEEFTPPIVLLSADTTTDSSTGVALPYDSIMLRAVGDVTQVQDGELLTQEKLDEEAAAIHTRYLEECLESGEKIGDRPTLYEWSGLPEAYKDENRDQVEHNIIKLRLLSLSSAAATSNPVQDFEADLIESLSITEHERWLASRYSRNWRFAEKRNDEKREHPDMVPWSVLPEPRRKLDRQMIRQLIARSSNSGQIAFCLIKNHSRTNSAEFEKAMKGCCDLLLGELSGYRAVLVADVFESETAQIVGSLVESGQADLLAVLQRPLKLSSNREGKTSDNWIQARLRSASGILAGPVNMEVSELHQLFPALRQTWIIFQIDARGDVSYELQILRREFSDGLPDNAD